jgi:hypothetical protein
VDVLERPVGRLMGHGLPPRTTSMFFERELTFEGVEMTGRN